MSVRDIEMLTTEKSSEIQKRVISFSPPDITESEIAEVAETLRSGYNYRTTYKTAGAQACSVF